MFLSTESRAKPSERLAGSDDERLVVRVLAGGVTSNDDDEDDDGKSGPEEESHDVDEMIGKMLFKKLMDSCNHWSFSGGDYV